MGEKFKDRGEDFKGRRIIKAGNETMNTHGLDPAKEPSWIKGMPSMPQHDEKVGHEDSDTDDLRKHKNNATSSSWKR